MKVSGVSFSSDRKLSRCEMQYSYRYDQGLKSKTKSKGLYMGSVMHDLIEAHRRKLDWKKVFKRFKKEQWDKLFDEEREMYEEKKMTPALVYELMSHYVERWGEADDRLKSLFIEQDFIIKTKIGILIRFKADYVAQDGKQIVLFENKNKGELPESDERILAPQPNAYCFLLSKLPQPIHVSKIVWDYIRTEPVPSPSLNKDGSISKKKINTDQRTYLAFLKENKIHPESAEDWEGIQNHLKSLPEDLTVQRVVNKPNLRVGEMFVRDWIERAKRARTVTKPTRTYTKSCRWECDYLTLCRADMLGNVDRQTIINKNFVTSIRKAGD